MPTEHHDEHGIEKPQPHPHAKTDAEHPGYEVTDVNTKGVVVFMGGMLAFVFIFFLFCWAAGKALNYGLLKQDGDEAAHNPQAAAAGGSPLAAHRYNNMANSPVMEQKESALIAQSFPTPRLDADDSNQSTSDLHAREDLLLDHYTAIEAGQEGSGAVRIPIDVAMQLLVKRGLPSSNEGMAPGAGSSLETARMTGDVDHIARAPLTNGFARTSYELEEMERRDQALELSKGQSHANDQHAKLEK